ncbi:hypothetical protein, partial [Pseudomonas proteolytica]|uniref:hypothetical protein n=1 Tax=Pseudomonas proteolytica TaxID=219574 RepID=UPI001964A3D3
SSPNKAHPFLSDAPRWLVLGLLRSPARGKPARHNKPAFHNKPALHNKPAFHNKPALHNKPAPHNSAVAPN